ncbi:hypothetical protein AUR64_13670 [Haloprofundus marisrubri]|uniref:Uncharacterized protein n=1 Tax=Haloprofundus marisrubri TaxID=1514971 RepID=A0A0W1R627_9EURY|nr:DUF5787 family protein [Haloprofundus marisrubri]KTG08858.1 hypothetical protein AUR64_13670 [Haloprofundus marisrubri]
MQEFGFELALCGHLEAASDWSEWLVARQLGGAVFSPGSRIVDAILVEPGPAFDARTRITPDSIPALAIESDVGVGRATYWRDAFDCHPETAREATDRAVELGFFEVERRGSRRYVRRTTRYPDDWFSRLVGIENKPDLAKPGDLERQLRVDVSLGLFDEVILATESYVTRAHLNRIPEEVGVWRFDPDSGEREVVREATTLLSDEPGVELLDERPLQTDIAIVSAEEKARKRRRIAERAYGKGWRTYELPPCARMAPTDDGRPHCEHFDCVVDPGSRCGESCPGFEAGEQWENELDEIRAERSPWVREPSGVARRQSGLDQFG